VARRRRERRTSRLDGRRPLPNRRLPVRRGGSGE
jgi:hypothetical protein